MAAGPHLGHPLPLESVGLQGIALPVWLEEGGQAQQVHAWADVQVDLPDPTVKGIHTPRLYLLLDAFAAAQPRQLLADAFAARFGAGGIDGAAACDWLQEHASLATPLQRP